MELSSLAKLAVYFYFRSAMIAPGNQGLKKWGTDAYQRAISRGISKRENSRYVVL